MMHGGASEARVHGAHTSRPMADAVWRALSPPAADADAIVVHLTTRFGSPLRVPVVLSNLPETLSIEAADLHAVYVPLLLHFRELARAASGRAVVGVVGPAGSGKTSLAALLASLADALADSSLDYPRTAKIEMDGYHLPNAELVELGLRARKGVIETMHGTALAADLERLQWGARADVAAADAAAPAGPLRARSHWSSFDDTGALLLPIYDRAGTHDPALNAQRITPDVRLVIVEGLFLARGDGVDGAGPALPLGPDASAWVRVRAALSAIVFLDAPLSLCRARCLGRRARGVLAALDGADAACAFAVMGAVAESLRALVEEKLVALVDHYERNDAPTYSDLQRDAAARSTLRLRIPLAPAFARAEAAAGGSALRVPWPDALAALRAADGGQVSAFAGVCVDP